MKEHISEVERVVDCRDQLGEGVFWCPVERAVYWLDIPTPSRLHRWVPETNFHSTWPMPEMISSMAKRNDGTLLIASQRGLNIFDPRQATFVRIAAPEADFPLNRSNDGATDGKGRFWYGTMRNNIAPDGTHGTIVESSGVLYKVEGDLGVVSVEGGVGIPNAICWSPDNGTFYFADSLANTIYAYDFDIAVGRISNKRVFSKIEGYGVPDGATVDSDGFVWNARWGAGCLIRFAPDGSIDRIVKIPASRVTCCAFGGERLETLYVTTARVDLSANELSLEPEAGSLFALTPGVRGLPKAAFAG